MPGEMGGQLHSEELGRLMQSCRYPGTYSGACMEQLATHVVIILIIESQRTPVEARNHPGGSIAASASQRLWCSSATICWNRGSSVVDGRWS